MKTTLLLLAALLAGATQVPLTPRAASAAEERCPAAPAEALPLPATRAALQAGKPLTVVAFGSSSTAGSGASEPGNAYPARLDALLDAALPGREVTVLNRGIGGQDVTEMLARLDSDVLAERPQLVVWQAGANAALRGMDPREFRDALGRGIERMRAAGSDVVLMDNQIAPALQASPLREAMAAAMREAAAAASVPVFSRTALMRAWEAAGLPPSEVLRPDGLHHNDRGYACLAEALGGSLLAGLRDAAAPMVALKR